LTCSVRLQIVAAGARFALPPRNTGPPCGGPMVKLAGRAGVSPAALMKGAKF